MTELFIWIIATISITIWQIAFLIKFIGVKDKKTVQTIQHNPIPSHEPITTQIKAITYRDNPINIKMIGALTRYNKTADNHQRNLRFTRKLQSQLVHN